MKAFEKTTLGPLELENRLVRSATFEGMCDHDGFPTTRYTKLYSDLARKDVGLIITGFSYISQEGSAIQPGQAGIDDDGKIAAFREVCELVHQHKTKIAMQIAHTGRQTRRSATGGKVWGVSKKKSSYFGDRPDVLTPSKIRSIIGEFANAAFRAQEAGFDAVQLHAAHGYLIHQFILPSINNRKDEFGVDEELGIGIRFLDQVIEGIWDKCGKDFPLLVKVSGSDDYRRPFTQEEFASLVQFLDFKRVSGIEVSFGTMDHALNIFRGSSIPYDTILDFDPVYRTRSRSRRFLWKLLAAPILAQKLKPYRPLYNMSYVKIARKHTDIPIVAVGGIRSGDEIETVLAEGHADLAGLCRPFIAEPDFVIKLNNNNDHSSSCINCNVCAVMTASGKGTTCYKARG